MRKNRREARKKKRNRKGEKRNSAEDAGRWIVDRNNIEVYRSNDPGNREISSLRSQLTGKMEYAGWVPGIP
jgi:hypothetical protein